MSAARAPRWLSLVFACLAPAAFAAAPLTTGDLTWLAGAWEGPLGEQTLEEYWAPPRAGAMTALVRFSRNEQLEMLEIVSITDTPDGLELRIAQWDPTLRLRAPAQTMRLQSAGERSVTFEAITEGGLTTLAYRVDTAGVLRIEVGLQEGRQLTIALDAQQP
ncbi:MAG: DUF6265 family protein [Pseudomonadota bacterium]